MADKEQVYVLCDNGSIMLHDLPLPMAIQDRIDRQQLRLVNADGSPLDEPAAVVVEPDSDEVPAGSITAVLGWVGDDLGRAQRALDAEQAAEKPRKGLTGALEELLTEPDA